MHLEHIIPLAAGGTSAEENLWLACPLCNGYKGIQTQAVDADTGELIPLFHPRSKAGVITSNGATTERKSSVSPLVVVLLSLLSS